MRTHTLKFDNEDTGESVLMTIAAGDVDLNEFFRAASMTYVQPHALAMELGRLTEAREREIMMQAYACGVVLDTEPRMTEREIFQWFTHHPGEFDILFEIADHRENFEDDANPNQHGKTGSAPVEGDQGPG